jgi:hypothetical protein
MAIDQNVFALLAALALFMAHRSLLLALRTPTRGRVGSGGVRVLAQSRAWPGIELYAPCALGAPWRATACCAGLKVGDLLLTPGGPVFAYRVLSVQYISRQACTLELAPLRPRELINSGRVAEPLVRQALALAAGQ